jgi:hypothetical protein
MKVFILCTFIAFVTITFITMKNDAASDGFSEYGFPLVFYKYSSGKSIIASGYAFRIDILRLLLDVIAVTPVGIVAYFVNKKWRNKKVN